MIEHTIVLLKPDCLQRGLVAEALSMLPFPMERMRLLLPDASIWPLHYYHHQDKEYYGRLIQTMRSGPIIGIAYSFVGAVAIVRGAAMKVREKYGAFGPRNVVHASDSVESGLYEYQLWKGVL